MYLFDACDDFVIENIAEKLLAQKLGASLAAFAQSCKRMRRICEGALLLYEEECSRIACIITSDWRWTFCYARYSNGEEKRVSTPVRYLDRKLDGIRVTLDKMGNVHSYGKRWALCIPRPKGANDLCEWYCHGKFIREECVKK